MNTTSNLVTTYDNKVQTTSVLFGKHFDIPHNHVVRKINKILEESKTSHFKYKISEDKFILSNWKNARGRTLQMYILDRDSFTLLLFQFSSAHGLERRQRLQSKQLEYIEEFNNMERIINEQMFEISNLANEVKTLKELLPIDQKGTISKVNGKPRDKIVRAYQRSTNGKEKIILDNNIKMFQASFKF